MATPQPQVVAAPTAQAAAEVKPEPKRVVVGGGSRRNSISSALASGSITDLMKSVSGNASAEESEDRYTDPQSEKKLQESKERFIAAIVAFAMLFSINTTAFAAATGTSAVTQPLENLKTLVIAVIGAVGVIILAKNVMEFAQAYQQQDSSTMNSALKGIVAGVMMAGISTVLTFLGF